MIMSFLRHDCIAVNRSGGWRRGGEWFAVGMSSGCRLAACWLRDSGKAASGVRMLCSATGGCSLRVQSGLPTWQGLASRAGNEVLGDF
jgi:hypothetical protein